MPTKPSEKKERKPSGPGGLVWILVVELLKLPWSKDAKQIHSRQFREAERLLKVYTFEEIERCLRAMHAAGRIRRPSIVSVLDVDPDTGYPHITAHANLVPPAPHSAHYDHWVRQSGKRALALKVWPGIYEGWGGGRLPDGRGGALTDTELRDIVGDDLADGAHKRLLLAALAMRRGALDMLATCEEARQRRRAILTF